MSDIAKLEGDVYDLQSKEEFPTRDEFVRQIRGLARVLFDNKPSDLDLDQESYERFLLELQRGHGLLMADVKRGVEDFKKSIGGLHA